MFQHQTSSANGPLPLYPYQPYACAPFNAGPTQPSNKPALTGYLYCHAKASDIYSGAQLQEVLQSLNIDMETPPPFEAVTAYARYPSHGVVKINNIPFTVTIQEVTQFVSRFSNIPMIKKHTSGYPVHIIMEKPTGKTMDCFVEFPSHEAARDCVKRYQFSAQPGRGTKIGTRCVSLDLSNQAELMRAVFPRARFAKFDEITGRPTIMSHSTDPSWTAGFRGYFNLEEIYGMTRFAETPARSPFVLKCNQRVYESMISTLYKFPWAATQTYTVAARNAIFEAAYKQLQVLSKKVDITSDSRNRAVIPYTHNQGYNQAHPHAYNGSSSNFYNNGFAQAQREVGLSQTLLFDLLFAALNVPAFSMLQKFALCQVAGPAGRGIPLSHLAANWAFQTLAPTTGADHAVTQFWLEIFDSGYDLISCEGTETTYEQYINFSRNRIGFPIAEWTQKGVELPFEDGIRVEMAAMMVYINRGRDCWAIERGLTVSRWEPARLIDLMESIAREKEAGRHFEAGEPRIHGPPESSVSPTTTEFTHFGFPVNDNIRNAPAPGTSANNQLGSVNKPRTADSRLNPATAKDFVPIAARKPSCYEPAPNNAYSAFKSIWSDPPIGEAQSSMAKLFINTNAGNMITTRSSINQDMASDPRMTLAFRNPFGPPSNETRGFEREDLCLDYLHSEKDGLRTIFKQVESQNRKSSHHSVNPASVSDQMRQLSVSTVVASRNNSNDTALASTTTSNELVTATTDATSYRNSSFTVDEDGSPTLKRMQNVQKYPNVTYSNVRPSPNNSQITFGNLNGQNQTHAQSSTGAYQAEVQTWPSQMDQIRAIALSSTVTDKLRTQSTPFAGYQQGQGQGQTQSSTPLRFPPGLEKRGSLPVNVNAARVPDYSAIGTPIRPRPRIRGETITEYDDNGSDDGDRNLEAGTSGTDGTAAHGRLSASELWKNVQGNY